MTLSRLFAVFAALVLSTASLAWGAGDDAATKARELYQKATAHYAVGEFEAAAEAYQEAYKVKQDPALLFNAAQSFRLAGMLDKALLLYKNYVRLYPEAKNESEVRARIEKLEAQIAADKAAAATPPPAPPTGAAPAPLPAASPPVEPAVSVTATAPVEQERPLTSKPWFWGAVGGALVVAAVVVGVALSGGESSWANVTEVRQAQGFGPGGAR